MRFGACAFAIVAVTVLLAGCASSDGPTATARAETPAFWGDRTIAMTYRSAEPIVAYFTAGSGEGRIYVWDGGEPSIVEGGWRLDGQGRVCMTLAAFRKASDNPPPLRARSPTCVPAEGGQVAQASYRGDVFQLNGKSEPPYILSAADNERLLTVLGEARRVTR